MLTELERAALNLLVELESQIRAQTYVPLSVIMAMNNLKLAASIPRYADAETILRFAKIAEEEKKRLENSSLSLKQSLYLVKDTNTEGNNASE